MVLLGRPDLKNPDLLRILRNRRTGRSLYWGNHTQAYDDYRNATGRDFYSLDVIAVQCYDREHLESVAGECERYNAKEVDLASV